MQKSLLYRFFGIGNIPQKVRSVLEAEEIVISDEGMGGWYITKNVKGPGKRFVNRKEGFLGCLVVTKKRIVCYTNGKRQINILVNDPKISSLFVEIIEPQLMVISFNSSVFNDAWEGEIKLRFKTEKAKQFYNALTEIGLQQGALT